MRRQFVCETHRLDALSSERRNRTRLAVADKGGRWEYRRPPNKALVNTEQKESDKRNRKRKTAAC